MGGEPDSRERFELRELRENGSISFCLLSAKRIRDSLVDECGELITEEGDLAGARGGWFTGHPFGDGEKVSVDEVGERGGEFIGVVRFDTTGVMSKY